MHILKSPSQISNELASKIRTQRKEQKLSQEGLSKRSSVSLGSIKRFESTGEISLSSLIKIAFVLGLEDDFDDLFARKSYTSIQEVIADAQKNS